MSLTLAQLSKIISEATSTLEKLHADGNISLPNLDDTSATGSGTLYSSPEATKAADQIVAASSQLVALLQPPPAFLLSAACGHIQSAALRVCVETNLVEFLREAGEQGLHVCDIASCTGLEKGKLGRIIRYLAKHHIFREVKPNVFANNRISAALDSKKSIDTITKSLDNKHDGSKEQSFPSLIELFAGDLHKSSSYLLENLQDPATCKSEAPNQTPFNRAFNVDATFFEWYHQPDQKSRLKRFLTGMQGTEELQPEDGLLTALDWKSLPADSVIVDVGGGWGKASLPLAQQYPHLRFVIQDKSEDVVTAKKTWEAETGQSVSDDRVLFQAHDFFTRQPVENGAVFVLKHVLHAFSDTNASKILKLLRDAATPTTQLLIIDSIIPYACAPNDGENKNNPTPTLLASGPRAEMAYISDLTMMIHLNAQERTLSDLTLLLESTGWKFTEVYPLQGAGTLLQPVRGVPF